jgi:hypothetical protein
MNKKLELNKEVIRVLSSDDLDEVLGGNLGPVSSVRPGPQTGYRPATTKVSSVKPNLPKVHHEHKWSPTSSVMHPTFVSGWAPGKR